MRCLGQCIKTCLFKYANVSPATDAASRQITKNIAVMPLL